MLCSSDPAPSGSIRLQGGWRRMAPDGAGCWRRMPAGAGWRRMLAPDGSWRRMLQYQGIPLMIFFITWPTGQLAQTESGAGSEPDEHPAPAVSAADST